MNYIEKWELYMNQTLEVFQKSILNSILTHMEVTDTIDFLFKWKHHKYNISVF